LSSTACGRLSYQPGITLQTESERTIRSLPLGRSRNSIDWLLGAARKPDPTICVDSIERNVTPTPRVSSSKRTYR